METSPHATKAAGDYIRDKKYTFEVLMDLKDPKTQINAAAAGYNVRGIPSKIVIDRSGNICFITLGNVAAGIDGFIAEMNEMITLAKM